MAKKQLELKQTGILDNKIYETFRYPDFYHMEETKVCPNFQNYKMLYAETW